MPTATANGIELFYAEDGPHDGVPLLLVMGFTAQLIAWSQGFVDLLTERGYRVIRFDNRDCGLSTKFDGVKVDVIAALAGQAVEAPYKLSDMAADAVGLLDHLGIDKAHIVGASMGGMIVQAIAIEHPERVLSLCSIMSTTGDPSVGAPEPDAMQALLTPPPRDRDAYIANGIKTSRIIGSKTHPLSEEDAAARAAASFDRSFYPEGASRQLAGIMTSGDRTAALAGVTAPTLVVHGLEDTLVTPTGGRATAAAIPGAELVELSGMGHDMPEPLWETIVDAIDKNARRV